MALEGYRGSPPTGPMTVSEGLASRAGARSRSASRSATASGVYDGHDHRLTALWMLGERAAVDVELDVLAALADELRQPAQRWHIGTVRTMFALMEGRFEEAERRSRTPRPSASVSRRAGTRRSPSASRCSSCAVSRAGWPSSPTSSRRSVARVPGALRFRARWPRGGELGQRARGARRAQRVLRSILRRVPRRRVDVLLASARGCVALRRASAARRGSMACCCRSRTLYTVAPVEGAFGAVACALGGLARALGRDDDAVRHLEAAIALERRMGARPGWPTPSSSSRRRSSGAAGRWTDPDPTRRSRGVRRRPKGLADRLLSRTPSLSARTTNRVRWRRRTPTRPLWHE